MNRTKIGWVKNPDGSQGYTWNPCSGCENHTPEGLCLDGLFPCYAWKLAHGRLKSRYLANDNVALPEAAIRTPGVGYLTDPFYPRFWEERLNDVIRGYHRADFVDGNVPCAAKARGIFVCDMGDLFGIGIPEEWTCKVLSKIKDWYNRCDRFYLLTKQPQNLIKWSPFPENCWVGVTACTFEMMDEALVALGDIEAKVKYVSIEPFLGEIPEPHYSFKPEVDWLIIGACTGTWRDMYELQQRYPDLMSVPLDKSGRNGVLWTALPRIEWVSEIAEACKKADIPYFLKDNLIPLLGDKLRQELPK